MSVGHYENFPVASLLIPARARPAVAAIYRFARYADDVADEGDAAPADRLAELGRLKAALHDTASPHPMVEPLRAVMQRHALPTAPFEALLSAFAQDVTVCRYAGEADLLDYCSRSANPVGELVLRLFDAYDDRRRPLSDAICSGLQLVNFVQDVAIDWTKGRLYVPAEDLARAGAREDDVAGAIQDRRATPALRRALAMQCRRAAQLFDRGRPLVDHVPLRLSWELRATIAGGRRILERLAASQFDPFGDRRPTLSLRDGPGLLRLALRTR